MGPDIVEVEPFRQGLAGKRVAASVLASPSSPPPTGDASTGLAMDEVQYTTRFAICPVRRKPYEFGGVVGLLIASSSRRVRTPEAPRHGKAGAA